MSEDRGGFIEEVNLSIVPQGTVELRQVPIGMSGVITMLLQMSAGGEKGGVHLDMTVGGSPHESAAESVHDIADFLVGIAESLSPGVAERFVEFDKAGDAERP